jgi:hypothetical protein
MVIQGQNPVAFGPTAAQVTVTSLTFDLVRHVWTLTYIDPASGQSKTVTGATPANVTTAVNTHAAACVQTAEGWGVAPTTVTP